MCNVKNLFLGFVFILLMVNLTANDTIRWQSNSLTIDGRVSDSQTNLKYYNSDLLMFYNLSNDSENLYIVLKIADKQMQQRIMDVGFSLGFKIKTKPKIEATINFPKANRMMDLPQISQEPQAAQNPGHQALQVSDNQNIDDQERFRRDNYVLFSTKAYISGFKGKKGYISKEDEANGSMTYSFDWDFKGDMAYEIRIPFDILFDKSWDLSAIKDYMFQLLIVVNAVDVSKKSMPPNAGIYANVQAAPMGMGANVGGMPGGQMGGSSGKMNAKMNKEQKLKLKFYLGQP